MLLMSPSTFPRRSSERLETILAAFRGHLEGLGRVGEAKMVAICGLEGVLGSSWGRPGGVLRPSWVSWGHCGQVGSERPPGDGFEGFQRSCGGVCEASGILRWRQDALSRSSVYAAFEPARLTTVRQHRRQNSMTC